jgi:SAM-dependent methyltransferase
MSEPTPRYLFDNAGTQTGERFAGLEAILDPITRRHLAQTGLGPGWSCWELGAGGGSVARWLSEQVGPDGDVLATDVNVDWMTAQEPANLTVRRHDAVNEPIPEAAYDLIHARLVLLHLPERIELIGRLVAALKVGGWLVLEEFDEILAPCPDASSESERLFNKVMAATRDLLRRSGADLAYGRRLPRLLSEHGLASVGGEGHVTYLTGGSLGASIQRANALQVGDQLVAAGLVTAAEGDAFLTLLDDPGFHYTSTLLVSAWGQRVDTSA